MKYKNLLKIVSLSILATSGLFAKLNLISWQKKLIHPESIVCQKLIDKTEEYVEAMRSGSITIGEDAQAHLEAIQETRKLISAILRKIHKEQETIKHCKLKDRKAKRESLAHWLQLAIKQHIRLTVASKKLDEELATLDDSINALAQALLPRYSGPPLLTTKLTRLGLLRPKARWRRGHRHVGTHYGE